MNIDISSAFQNGNAGLTIFPHDERGFMVSVKGKSGFSIGYGETPQQALDAVHAVKQAAARAKSTTVRVQPKPVNRDDDLI